MRPAVDAPRRSRRARASRSRGGSRPRCPAPTRPGRRDARDRLVERHVGVVGLVARHREAAGVGEDVAERAALLAVAPRRRGIRATRSSRPSRPSLPELEDGDRRPRLARRVPEHESSGCEGPSREDLADRGVEQHLAAEGDVDLRPSCQPGRPLALAGGRGARRGRVRPGGAHRPAEARSVIHLPGSAGRVA